MVDPQYNREQDKRRSNILKSREIRKRSAKGARPAGEKTVFDRLSNVPKKQNPLGNVSRSSNNGSAVGTRPAYQLNNS